METHINPKLFFPLPKWPDFIFMVSHIFRVYKTFNTGGLDFYDSVNGQIIEDGA
jgi:hypothetical protein